MSCVTAFILLSELACDEPLSTLVAVADVVDVVGVFAHIVLDDALMLFLWAGILDWMESRRLWASFQSSSHCFMSCKELIMNKRRRWLSVGGAYDIDRSFQRVS